MVFTHQLKQNMHSMEACLQYNPNISKLAVCAVKTTLTQAHTLVDNSNSRSPNYHKTDIWC